MLNNLLERDLNKNDNYLSTLFDCIVNHFETDNFRNNEKNNKLNEYSFKNNNINILESVVNNI